MPAGLASLRRLRNNAPACVLVAGAKGTITNAVDGSMSRRWICLGLMAVALALLPLAAPAVAQPAPPEGFPDRPLVIVVPYGKGGGSHQLSAAMAAALRKVVGQKVRLLNRPGRGGINGLEAFQTMEPDGYSVLQHIDDVVSLYAAGAIKVNPAEDLAPLAITQITFSQIYIRALETRFSDWDSFQAYARANPGEVTIANVGAPRSMERVSMFNLEQATGIVTKTVAFDKPAERYQALIRGDVDLLFEQPGDVRPFLDRKLIKPILTLLPERPHAFAEAASLNDLGIDTAPLLRFRGFYVHKNVPEAHRKYLEWAFAEAFKSRRYQKFNRKKYMDLIDSYRDTEGSRELINKAVETYRQSYKMMGISQ